jgi:hypothetical protein
VPLEDVVVRLGAVEDAQQLCEVSVGDSIAAAGAAAAAAGAAGAAACMWATCRWGHVHFAIRDAVAGAGLLDCGPQVVFLSVALLLLLLVFGATGPDPGAPYSALGCHPFIHARTWAAGSCGSQPSAGSE